eukprot:Anaeramoba_ignava/a348332_91.p1 GENE.a348332_91~~a348332_91.p1  ORF type:complete len:223 (+),score=47.25 a348332_91:12-680(+)
MKTLTLVIFADDMQQLWYRISKDDIVESFYNDSLKVVSKDIVKKYNIKENDKKDKFAQIYELIADENGYDVSWAEGHFSNEDIKLVKNYINKSENLNEEFEDALNDCDYAETFEEDMVKIDSIKENLLYFDNYNNEFFTGADILGWETEKYYWYHDGSNWRLKAISEIKEIEAEYIGSENYNTGNLQEFELKNGKRFVIDSSMYQGSIDNVQDEYAEVIEEA